MPIRLIQIFLSEGRNSEIPNIFEVSTDDNKSLICTCPGFISKESCKHTELVNERIEDNNWRYPFDFTGKVSPEQIKEAMADEKSFREFIIDKTRIEVF